MHNALDQRCVVEICPPWSGLVYRSVRWVINTELMVRMLEVILGPLQSFPWAIPLWPQASLMTQHLGLGLLCPPQVPVFSVKSSGDHILGFCAGEVSGCIETGSICMLLQPCPLCRYLEDGTNANECCFKYSSGQLY